MIEMLIRRNCRGALVAILAFFGLALAQSSGAEAEAARAAAGFTWQTAAPESVGFRTHRLAELQGELAATGTTGLLIACNDRLIYEWYAADWSATKLHGTASLAKALIGGVSLAVAIGDGLISLDTPASKLIPQWRDDPRKARITIRQLGSHAAGLEDAEEAGKAHNVLSGWKGDFWKQLPVPNDPFTISRDRAPIEFEPGTRRAYSNPGIAMLTYAVTAALRDAPIKDVRTLLRERVYRPIGIADKEWNCGYGKTYVVDGLPLIGSWGGAAFTPRAAARVGRLMLRQGDWDGQPVLSARAVRETTHDAGTPGPGGMGWWNNEEGFVPALPRDAFWGSGAYGQILLVIPSMRLVVVRNGNAIGKTDTAVNDNFFTPLMRALTRASPVGGDMPPRGQAPTILAVDWAPKTAIVRLAQGSDNWPLTWADDDALYGAYGDGNGFEPFVPRKLSLGLAKISGTPPELRGINLQSASGEAFGDGPAGRKASGMLMVDGVIYLLVRNVGNAQIGWSADHGATWAWAPWKFTTSFGAPTFINFGKNYAGARDDYVYVVSHDSTSAYMTADDFVLARAPKGRLGDKDAWEFYAGLVNGAPRWTADADGRASILRATGECYRAGVSYAPALRRYLLVHAIRTEASRDTSGKIDTRFSGGLAIYEAPEPWGPWTRVFHAPKWDVGPGDSASFPPKWISDDGRTLWLVFSGGDAFCVREATLTIREHAIVRQLAEVSEANR